MHVAVGVSRSVTPGTLILVRNEIGEIDCLWACLSAQGDGFARTGDAQKRFGLFIIPDIGKGIPAAAFAHQQSSLY